MCIDVKTAMQAVTSVLLKGLHWQLTFLVTQPAVYYSFKSRTLVSFC